MCQVKHIVSLSGGKDSTAMLLMMIEKGMPVDEIVFMDTAMEFTAMYEHIKKVERYIEREITTIKGANDFEYYLYKHKKKSKRNKNLGYGFPRKKRNRWCTSRLKTEPFNKYIKAKYNNEAIRYIGIAYDERERCKNYNYPLVEWKITEKQALEYCYSKGFDWGGLYEKFDRVSCWCCPMHPLRELKNLYKYYPKYWQQLKEWESKTYNNFRCDYTLEQLENRFKRQVYLEENQVMLEI